MYYLTRCLSDTEFEIVNQETDELFVMTKEGILNALANGKKVRGVVHLADDVLVCTPYTMQALSNLQAVLKTECSTCTTVIDRKSYTVTVSGFGDWKHYNNVVVVDGEQRLKKGRGVLKANTVLKLSGIIKQVSNDTDIVFDYKVLPNDTLVFYAFEV